MSKTASGLSPRALKRGQNGRLDIPKVGEPIPADWWKTHAVPAFDALERIEDVQQDIRLLDALARYVKDREQRGTVNKSRIIGEMRIGELLGRPPGQGSRTDLTTRGEVTVTQQDWLRFWSLASHRRLVEKLLNDIDSRGRILARLEREKRSKIERPEGIEVRHGDFRKVLGDLTDQVDAIITDPPYPKEYLPLYGDLSKVAADILRPGGICAVMCGQSYLPELTRRLGEHLDYRWMMAYLTPGASTSGIRQRRIVNVQWKPILVYEKPPTDVDHFIGADVVRSPGPDSDGVTHHHWGQNEAGMLALIQRLTEPGSFIVDPFVGAGTTLLAAAAAGRTAVGCDTDAAAVASANARLG